MTQSLGLNNNVEEKAVPDILLLILLFINIVKKDVSQSIAVVL